MNTLAASIFAVFMSAISVGTVLYERRKTKTTLPEEHSMPINNNIAPGSTMPANLQEAIACHSVPIAPSVAQMHSKLDAILETVTEFAESNGVEEDQAQTAITQGIDNWLSSHFGSRTWTPEAVYFVNATVPLVLHYAWRTPPKDAPSF